MLRLNNLPRYKFQNVHKFHIELKGRSLKMPPPKANVQEHEETVEFDSITNEYTNNSTPTSEPISWANVLDPSNLKPISLNRVNESTIQTLDESDNLSIFELLEQQSNSNCQLTDTFVKEWIEGKTNPNGEDGTVAAINEFYLNDHIQPLSRIEAENLGDNDSSSSESVPTGTAKTVHFSNKVLVNEMVDSSDYNSTSTPNNPRERYFAGKSSTSIGSNENDRVSTSGTIKQQIIESSDFLMERLKELEEQIDTFKKSNRELTKEKQDHDREKAHFEEEKTRFYNELNEDRIKMKNYFDQEKIKIENERKRLKKIIEDNNLLKKEKDLNIKLKKVSSFFKQYKTHKLCFSLL